MQQTSKSRLWGFRILIVALALLTAYLTFELGRIQAGHNILDVAAMTREHNARVDALQDEIRSLKEEVARLETHKQIDAEAYREVEASLADLQSKIREQRDAIEFYRGIVSPSDGGAGLRVQDFSIESGRSEREFELRLVLVQAMQHDRRVSGDVVLVVAGEENGESATYTWADLRPEGEDAGWAYSFRYFQDFERELILPNGFTPLTVNIEVRSRTRSISSIEASFPWALARS